MNQETPENGKIAVSPYPAVLRHDSTIPQIPGTDTLVFAYGKNG
jgi:hypothetical protein